MLNMIYLAMYRQGRILRDQGEGEGIQQKWTERRQGLCRGNLL
jgi:hypothetical protein